MESQYAICAFNRGKISPLALARTDFKQTALSAEVQTNWMPRALGSMMLRPGTGYLGATKTNQAAVAIPFIFATDDTARLEITNLLMRVWVNDTLITRPSVATTIVNGTFDSNLTGWTDLDGGSATSDWITGGYMSLIGTVNAPAKRQQQVICATPNVLHAVNFDITRGPVTVRIGSTSNGDEYITETFLGTGYHSLAFTPTGDFYVAVFNYNQRASLINSITIASAGVMELTAPWPEAALADIRWDQSGDVVFVACDGYQQRRIERRANGSWSIIKYDTNDGPFRIQNVGPITITPAATTGDTTLTASTALFRSSHVGTLFRLTQSGQSASAELTAGDQFTDPIRVTGIGATRAFSVSISGTFVATVRLQYSVAAPGDWIDTAAGAYTVPQAVSYSDTLDNQIIYYRLGIKAGQYTSGTAEVSLNLASGSQTGICRITGFTSKTVVDCAVITAFGAITATADWSEGAWSDYRGWPSVVVFYEGRLWWLGKDQIKGSVSDAFASYDDTVEGDSGPIQRSIGSGPVQKIRWALAMQRLVFGADGSIWSARSSSFDEPLTPTNFNLKEISTQGSAAVNAVRVDTAAGFVQRSGVRVYEAAYDANVYDYGTTDLTERIPEIGVPSIIRMGVQRQPETRIHCIRSDGTVAIMVYDKAEDVSCWIDFETDGIVEDVIVEPGTVEDKVTYLVKRTINSATVRYYERWALESECAGGTLNKQADAFVSALGSGASISGLSHLIGETVVCWADGEDKGTFTVSGGGTIAQAYTTGYVVGLGYTAQYKSTKLAYGVAQGSALGAKKRVSQIAVVARNVHPAGLRYGPDFDRMDNLPLVEKAEVIDPDVVRATYDEEMFSFDGLWDTDSRLCLAASAPRPVTLLAAIVNLETSQK